MCTLSATDWAARQAPTFVKQQVDQPLWIMQLVVLNAPSVDSAVLWQCGLKYHAFGVMHALL